MNLDSNLERNYRSTRIKEMKEELRKERVRAIGVVKELLQDQYKIILDIQNERKLMRSNNRKIKEEERLREEQKNHTLDFFKTIYHRLAEKTHDNITRNAKYSIFSHGRDGQVIKFFTEGYINIELLHSLCYKNNIHFTSTINYLKKGLSLEFMVDPTIVLTSKEYTESRTANNKNFDYFYQNFAIPHKIYIASGSNGISENTNGIAKRKGAK